MQDTGDQLWVIVPAAGAGQRMATDLPKQYLPLAGRCVLEHSLSLFINHARIAGVIVVVAATDTHWTNTSLSGSDRVHTVIGGAERFHSVMAGLAYLKARASDNDWVLVHDAARPCLSRSLLDGLIQSLAGDPVGGLLAMPAIDTIKQSENGRVSATLDRAKIWQAQTPQMFRLLALHAALQSAIEEGLPITDEASAMEHAGHAPRLVEGSAENLKITRPEDLQMAELILQKRQSGRVPG